MIAILLGLNVSVPDHTAFSRRNPELALATALGQAQATGPMHVAIDATSSKIHGAGELHLAVNPNTGEVLTSELTRNDKGDVSQVGPLLQQIPGPIASVIADGAHDGKPAYRAVAERQPDPPMAVVIPPRSTAVPGPTAGTTATSQRDQHIQTT